MQMFVVDRSPLDAAQCLCDAHIRVIGREVSMCLSAWYAMNMGHAEELPYKPFNHPVVWQMANPYTRMWARSYANNIFREFSIRFGHDHASENKFQRIITYSLVYDQSLNPWWTPDDVYEHARFSFIQKGHDVVPEMDIDTAIFNYRAYYREKCSTMRVPVVWTYRTRPWWLNWRDPYA